MHEKRVVCSHLCSACCSPHRHEVWIAQHGQTNELHPVKPDRSNPCQVDVQEGHAQRFIALHSKPIRVSACVYFVPMLA